MQGAEAARRNALLRQEMSVEIRDIVVADAEADISDRQPGIDEQLARAMNAQGIDVLNEGHSRVFSEIT